MLQLDLTVRDSRRALGVACRLEVRDWAYTSLHAHLRQELRLLVHEGEALQLLLDWLLGDSR